jgi:adenylylsulfate kinase-like enzyme
MNFNKKKGILFWVTGLSGSGKTAIAKKIKTQISKLYGPTIIVSGDDLRRIFNLNKYDYLSRLNYSRKFCKFAKFITNQKINLIFAIVGMMNEPRKWNRKNIDNYLEIYIKSNIKKIISQKKKKIYFISKTKKNIVGINIKPELPKNYDILIQNNFNKSLSKLANELISKIKKKIK